MTRTLLQILLAFSWALCTWLTIVVLAMSEPAGGDGGPVLAPQPLPAAVARVLLEPWDLEETPPEPEPEPQAAPEPAPEAPEPALAAASAEAAPPPSVMPKTKKTRPPRPGKKSAKKPPPKPKEPKPCEEPDPRIVQIAEYEWTVDRDLIESYMYDLEAANKLAWTGWHRDDAGEIDGFKVKRIGCGNVLDQAGFENNDIIVGINGLPVTTIPQAILAYQKLRNKHVLQVSVKRGEDLVTLTYTLLSESYWAEMRQEMERERLEKETRERVAAEVLAPSAEEDGFFERWRKKREEAEKAENEGR